MDEARLMEMVRNGDAAAFGSVMERHWNRTFLHARYLLRDHDQAVDATQEVFVRLWQARERLEATGSLGAWLARAVRNLVANTRRSRRVHLRWASWLGGQEAKRPRTPLQEVETEEISAAIRTALDRLPPRRREVFVLFYLRGLSYREISEVMEIRPQSVANYLQAALTDLRASLKAHFPGLADHDLPYRPES